MSQNKKDQIPPPAANEVDATLSRRELVQRLSEVGAGALAVAMGGGGVLAILGAAPQAQAQATKPVGKKQKFRYGMVIDTRRCVGCEACVVACKAENKTPPGIMHMKVLERPIPGDTNDKPRFFARPCYHCENPACLSACPAKAIIKRGQDGIVVIDYDKCQGYQRCVSACPYGQPEFDDGANYPAVAEKTPFAQVPSPELGQFRKRVDGEPPIDRARKCTFCLHLQDENGRYNKAEGRWPACAKTCTGHAIFFGDFNDPNSDVSRLLREGKAIRLKEEAGTKPNVYYLL